MNECYGLISNKPLRAQAHGLPLKSKAQCVLNLIHDLKFQPTNRPKAPPQKLMKFYLFHNKKGKYLLLKKKNCC